MLNNLKTNCYTLVGLPLIVSQPADTTHLERTSQAYRKFTSRFRAPLQVYSSFWTPAVFCSVDLSISSPFWWNRSFANAYHWSVSWASWIVSILHIRLCFQVVYSSRFSYQNFMRVYHLPMLDTCPTRTQILSSHTKPELLACSNSVLIWNGLSIYFVFFSRILSSDVCIRSIWQALPRPIFESVASVCPWPLGPTCGSYLHCVCYCTRDRAVLRSLREIHLDRTMCPLCNDWKRLLCNVFEIPEGRELIVGSP